MKTYEHVVAWIVKIGLFVIPFLPLYVSSSLLFPFITGKNFAFRIITEVIFLCWIWLAAANPSYRPKLTFLFKVVTIFTTVVFLADLFGPNPYRSLFANYERMEGFMMIGHLYLYYVMLSSVLRKRDWMLFFHSTLLASLLVSYIGLTQKLGYRISLQGGFRVDSTIGNPTYLATYLVFNIWIILILAYIYRKHWWALSLYGLVFLFELIIVYFTATRGAIIGLVVASVALVVAAVWQWSAVFPSSSGQANMTRWPFGRKIAASILVMIVIVPTIFLLARNTEMIQSNQILRRLTNYSLQEGTIQARFHIWGQSWKGFLERPILGWGQENYYLVFQKYYNPALWGDEPWFDRSHNIFFDWLIHAGLLGLGSYLTMYIAVFAGIINVVKKNSLLFWHGAVIIAALAAHLLQTIFVFDNLNTYLLFFAFLAYGSFLTTEYGEAPPVSAHSGLVPHRYARANAIALCSAGFIVLSSYYLHIAPIKQSKALLRSLIAYQEHVPMDQQLKAFKEALAYNSFGTTEVREQIVNLAGSVIGNQRYSNAEQAEYITFAIEEMRKETDKPAKDIKHMIFLGSLLSQGMASNPGYQIEAKRVLEEASTLSPTKQPLAFELAQFYLLIGQQDAARDVLYRAWKLDTKFKIAGVHAWVLAIVTRRSDIAEEVMKTYPLDYLSESDLVRLGESYRRVEEYGKALVLYNQLVVIVPDNAKYRATYAALLAHEGRTAEARVQAQEAIRIDPNFAGDAGKFLQQL